MKAHRVIGARGIIVNVNFHEDTHQISRQSLNYLLDSNRIRTHQTLRFLSTVVLSTLKGSTCSCCQFGFLRLTNLKTGTRLKWYFYLAVTGFLFSLSGTV